MSLRTPYGVVIDLGTEEDPNLGGPAQAVGYARGVLDAKAAMSAAVDHARCAKQATDALDELLKK